MAELSISNVPARRAFQRRRKVCPFSGENAPKIDYKDIKLLHQLVQKKDKINGFDGNM